MYNYSNPQTVNEIGGIQGDVPFIYIDELPPTARKIEKGIVAFAEATGHHHIIEGTDQEREIYQDETGGLFALVKQSVRVLHQDHGPLTLTPGVVQVGVGQLLQIEYDGAEERRVLD